MVDTTDLTSYIPGYDDWCEPREEMTMIECDLYEERVIERELMNMKRKVIDMNKSELTVNEIFQLENYIWKGNYLIPEELLEVA